MTDFQPGEIVDITIKGVRIQLPEIGQTRHIRITDEHDNTYAMPPQAAITRVAPADWPPQVGDLWRDQFGDLWFGYEDYDQANDSYVGLRCSIAKSTQAWGDQICYSANAEYGPMVLVHRETSEVAR